MGFWEMRLELVLCLQDVNVFCNLLSDPLPVSFSFYSSYLYIKFFTMVASASN